MTLRRRRAGLGRALWSGLVDYAYSFRHWYRWKVRQRPHTGWPDALLFFVFVVAMAWFLVSHL